MIDDERLEDKVRAETNRIEDDSELLGEAFRDLVISIVKGEEDQEHIDIYGQMLDSAVNCKYIDRYKPLNTLVSWAARRKAKELVKEFEDIIRQKEDLDDNTY